MTSFLAEIIGTALLILLGDGVVANVVLKGTKGNNSGWIVITFGWAMAVFVGVFVSASASGAHLNPAVTVALAAAGKFDWPQVPVYILAQMLGACLGASMGFMLPVSTPPNAIVYGSGCVPLLKMVRYGLALDLVGFAVIVPVTTWLVPWLMKMH